MSVAPAALEQGDYGVGEIWTVQEAADWLKCSREHVRKLIEKCGLPATDIGLGSKQHEYRLYPEDVQAWVKRRQMRVVEAAE